MTRIDLLAEAEGVDGAPDGEAAEITTAFIPRPAAFWTGAALNLAGVSYHVWMFLRAAPQHFVLAGMPMGSDMWAAMVAIVAGTALSCWGLTGPGRRLRAPPPRQRPARPIGPKRLVAVMAFAMLVDQMKPTTLAFIEPGMCAEYGLTQAQVAWLPTVALTGTVAGSLLLGLAADRLGRRATILTASLLFLGTTVCGAMPTFSGNLVMCFLMGISAGGMLPAAYALLRESLPPARRSTMMVLLAGLTSSGGFLAVSGSASLLLPLAGWRALWFVQLPLALALIALNRYIPETAAFTASAAAGRRGSATGLLRRPYAARTALVGGYAVPGD